MSAAPKASQQKFAIEVVLGHHKGQVFTLDKDRITIGRNSSNDITLNDPKISRHHAVIEVIKSEIHISNVSDQNVLKVNGKAVVSGPLNNGDEITIGHHRLVFKFKQFGVAKSAKDDMVLVPTSKQAVNSSQQQNRAVAVGGAAHPARGPQQGGAVAHPQPQSSHSSQAAGAASWEAPQPKKSKLTFYIIAAVLVGGLIYLITAPSPTPPEELGLRDQTQITADIEDSKTRVEKLKEQRERSGLNSKQYEKAQANYVKGRRDFQTKKYSRAIQSFQAALAIFPKHPEARRYLMLSIRKNDEQIQKTMIQGRRAYEKKNYRVCQSRFAMVMTMIRDRRKQIYREAKQMHDECTTYLEGRY